MSALGPSWRTSSGTSARFDFAALNQIIHRHAKLGTLAEPVLSVRPGLTGRWAVSGRSEISYEERVQLEYEYATAWTPLGDVGILLRTVPAVFRGHGAY